VYRLHICTAIDVIAARNTTAVGRNRVGRTRLGTRGAISTTRQQHSWQNQEITSEAHRAHDLVLDVETA
jgi:hypothetical protein